MQSARGTFLHLIATETFVILNFDGQSLRAASFGKSVTIVSLLCFVWTKYGINLDEGSGFKLVVVRVRVAQSVSRNTRVS